MNWRKRCQWVRAAARLVLLGLTLVICGLALHSVVAGRPGSTHFLDTRFACPPDDCEPETEIEPAPRKSEAGDDGWSAQDALIALLLMTSAFIVGRISRTEVDRPKIIKTIQDEFDKRIAEARLHEEPLAANLLETARTNVIDALSKQLPGRIYK